MDVQVHHDPAAFRSLASPIYQADPVRHTVAVTVLDRLVNVPDPDAPEPLLVSLHDRNMVVGAAVRTSPWPLVCSGIPAVRSAEAASLLRSIHVAVSTLSGPRDAVEPFAAAWAALTGATCREVMAHRLYGLAELVRPTVPGTCRLAREDDVTTLAGWRRDFEIEAMGSVREPGRHESIVRRALALGNGQLLWVADGALVAWAAVSVPSGGMSRIGPVYTPPWARRHGYGSAVTAAASAWALDRGAVDIVLFTDLANPTTNSIYQKIGYRPVHDAVELEFETAEIGLPSSS